MGFFLWLIIIFLGTSLIFRLFGRQIMTFFLKQIMKQVAKDVESQQKAYERNYSRSAYKESIHINDNIRVDKPVSEQKKRVQADEIAEDVEFEELD